MICERCGRSWITDDTQPEFGICYSCSNVELFITGRKPQPVRREPMAKNQWIGEGNLTRDAELSYTQGGGKAVLKFAVACNERYQDRNTGEWKDGDTYFMDCTAWEALAERWSVVFVKGTPVHVEGKLKLDEWEDKQTGAKRSKTVCTVFQMHAMVKPPRKEGSGDSEESSGGQQPQSARRPANDGGRPASTGRPTSTSARPSSGGFSADL